MTDRALIESSVVALVGVASLCEIYGDRHAAVLRQANDVVPLLERLRAARAQVVVYLMPDKVVIDQVSHVVSTPGAIAAIDRLIALGATSISIRPGLSMLAVLEACSALSRRQLASAASAALQFGRTAIDGAGNAQSGAAPDCGWERPAGSSEAIQSAWQGVRLGQCDQIMPLIALASDIASTTTTRAGTVLPMARLADHDEYTFSHTVNVGLLASALAAEVGLSRQQVEDITVAALLHDIGKLQVPKSISSKEGPLNDAERARVMMHPVDGAALLYGAPGVPRVAAIVAFEHHMNLNGTGYPVRLKHRVSCASEIVHIADVFDALRTHRPYRAAMSEDEALRILQADAGKAFDPELLNVFMNAVVKRAA